MQLRNEMGIGGGRRDSMDREKIRRKKKKKRGREGKPQEERVSPKGERMKHFSWVAGTASSILQEACGHFP